jgi:hypothetical protein
LYWRKGGERLVAKKEGKGIPKELYDKLRAKTPSQEIRDIVNKGKLPPYDDPVLPGLKVTGRVEADHIVPMKRIAEMDGFDALSFDNQLKVLNNHDNFIGLSPTANRSRGVMSFSEWTKHEKLGIEVDPAFRQEMILKEQQLEGQLQQQIDELLKVEGKNNKEIDN